MSQDLIQAPDFNNITCRDLEDDERLVHLYFQAVRADFWPNAGSHSVHTFVALAEKALQEAKDNTHGRLFYALVRAKDLSKISNTQDERARLRFSSVTRDELFLRANNVPKVKKRPAADGQEIAQKLYGRKVGFHHGVMIQCTMPQQRTNALTWQADHGKASLSIEAGRIPNPSKRGEFIQRELPSGSRARIILPYINAYAIQHKTRDISMGESLRRFIEGDLGMAYGGKQGNVITEQVQNIAAAQFLMGYWDDDETRVVTGEWARVAKRVSFWIERDPVQGVLWEQSLTLSQDYYDGISEHRVPVDMEHKLAGSPRRQDLYAWFSYRLPRLKSPLNMPYTIMHTVFGQSIDDPYKWRQTLKGDVAAIHRVYGDFNIEIPHRKDYIKLSPSRSPIPQKITRMLPNARGYNR